MKSGSFYNSDPWLKPYAGIINARINKCTAREKKLTENGTLADFALGHLYYGLHRKRNGWVFREWAPNATSVFMTGTFSDWKESEKYALKKISSHGDWEIELPLEALKHEDLYKLSVHWEGGMEKESPPMRAGWFRMMSQRYSALRYGHRERHIAGNQDISILRIPH